MICFWHVPKPEVAPPGHLWWLPCFAPGPDERLSADTWVMANAKMTDGPASDWSIASSPSLWLAETMGNIHNISHLTMSNNYPEGDKLSRLGPGMRQSMMWAWWAMPVSSRPRCWGSVSQSEAGILTLNQWKGRQLSSLISGISSPAGNGFTVATFYAALKQGAVNSRWQQVPLALIGWILFCRAPIGLVISSDQYPLSKPKQWYVTKSTVT